MSLFAARNKDTGFYSDRVINFLMGEQDWLNAKNPTLDEVKQQIDFIDSRRTIWVTDINDAEMWSDYTIKTYGKYLDNVEFIPVTLSVEAVTVT